VQRELLRAASAHALPGEQHSPAAQQPAAALPGAAPAQGLPHSVSPGSDPLGTFLSTYLTGQTGSEAGHGTNALSVLPESEGTQRAAEAARLKESFAERSRAGDAIGGVYMQTMATDMDAVAVVLGRRMKEVTFEVLYSCALQVCMLNLLRPSILHPKTSCHGM
jgi:hypothetical protein